MLRRPAKDALGNYQYSTKKVFSPAKASHELEQLALKLNAMGSKEGADMLLQALGAEFVMEDTGLKFQVYGLKGEKIYVCHWIGDIWKYLTNSDLQNGKHSWITNTVRKMMH